MKKPLVYLPKRKSPVTAKKYDVGCGEMLTARQIATKLGCAQTVVLARIRKGWTGASLLTDVGERRRPGQPRTQTAVVAYQLATKFGRKLPSTAEIRAYVPMDESTAAYWRHAIRIALEKSNTPRKGA